jgi:hypothetical protein
MNATVIFFYIAVIFLIIFIVHMFSVQRRKKLAAYAQSKGWHFNPAKDKTMMNRYPSFKCLRRGHSRWAHNIMRGKTDGRDVMVFDYHYVTGHGKNRRVHQFSAFILTSPLPLKPLYLRPENIFDKVSDFFGFDDIDFESAEFSRKFFVKAPEKQWAYHVIHQRMMAYLLDSPRFHIQFDPENIMVWRNKRFREEDFDSAFDLIQGMLSRLPEYLKKQQKENKLSGRS